MAKKEKKEQKKKKDSNEPSSGSSSEMPRRDFLVGGGVVLLGAAGISSLAAGVRFASPDFSSDNSTKFALGGFSDFKMNTLSWLREKDLFVIHDKIGFGAFSAKCTHLGCIVQRTSEGFQCPCHGARFGPMGEVLCGPARKDLPWYELWADTDGMIWIDTSSEVPAKTRPLSELKRQARDES